MDALIFFLITCIPRVHKVTLTLFGILFSWYFVLYGPIYFLVNNFQIIKMEGGRIVAQGTLDDIIAAYPDMYQEYQQAVKAATESEAEFAQSGYESESMRQDRILLESQVKKEEHRSEGMNRA